MVAIEMQLTNRAMSQWYQSMFQIRALAFLSLLFGGLSLSGCGKPSETDFNLFVQQQNCVTADQIYRDYQRNEVAAQQRYSGQINRVCGVINEIELNWLNEPLISLDASGWGYVSIGGLDTASAARMTKGSFAVFECEAINELLGDPVLTDCKVAHAHISNAATSRSDPPVEDRVVGVQQQAEFKAANDHALIIGRDYVGGGGEAAWERFDAAFSEVSSFSKKGIPFCNLEVTAYVSYSVPCGYQQNYLYVFTNGLQGIPFSVS